MNAKKPLAVVAALMLLSAVFTPYIYASGGGHGGHGHAGDPFLEKISTRLNKIKKWWDKDAKTLEELEKKYKFKEFITTHHFEHVRLIFYIVFFLYPLTYTITSDVAENLEYYILMNPDPTRPEVMNVMNFFISNIQKLYLLAITATAMYLLFASLSPRKRALSKYMLGRLVLGFILVTISPQIINISLNLSEMLTANILDQAESSVVAAEYGEVMWRCLWLTTAIIMTPVAIEYLPVYGYKAMEHKWVHEGEHVIEHIEKSVFLPDALKQVTEEGMTSGTPYDMITDLDVLESIQKTAERDAKERAEKSTILLLKKKSDKLTDKEKELLKKAEQKLNENFGKMIRYNIGRIMEKVPLEPRPEFSFPFLMLTALIFFGLYGFLALRYLMVMVWVLLFPLTVFFLSFELTKGLGRNMLEQTIYWVIMQIFYAVGVAVVAAGISAIPEGYDFYQLGFGSIFQFMSISFFSIGALIVFLLTPLFLLMLTQRRTA